MFLGQRSVQLISLAGHLSTLERHEASALNSIFRGDGLFGSEPVRGLDAASKMLEDNGFIVGPKIRNNAFKIQRTDGTEINNAYLDIDEFASIEMNKPFSPKEHFKKKEKEFSLRDLVEKSKSGPGHIYETFIEED